VPGWITTSPPVDGRESMAFWIVAPLPFFTITEGLLPATASEPGAVTNAIKSERYKAVGRVCCINGI
jgi:hypothetical protein